MQKGDGVGGRGEFGGEDFQSAIRVDNDRAIVIHGCFPLLWPALHAPWQAFVSVLRKLCCAPPLLPDILSSVSSQSSLLPVPARDVQRLAGDPGGIARRQED